MAMARLEPHWVEVDGVPVHARVTLSPRVGPPVVLVHGLVTTGRQLETLAERLGATFRVWVPDLPGYGLSGDPTDVPDVDRLGDALAAWMRAVALDPAVLVGHSFGCQIAVACAARHPRRVRSLVLQGPTIDATARGILPQLARFLQNAPQEPGAFAALLEQADAGLRRALHSFRAAFADAIEERLPGVSVPTLVVTGERDPIAPPHWARAVAAKLPKGEVAVVPDAPHAVARTAPETLERIVRAFVTGRSVRDLEPAHAEPPRWISAFDPGAAMARATTRVLRGDDFPDLGVDIRWSGLLPAINLAPEAAREGAFRAAGWLTAVAPEDLDRVDVDDACRWVADSYVRRPYPMAFVGSANGALVHLFAALDAPWLPQTFMVPARLGGGDFLDMVDRMNRARPAAERLLDRNPHTVLTHAHDPNHDHLSARHTSHFHLKLRKLGPAYEAFLRATLPPGGTIVVVDCQQRWPLTRVGPRHWFQAGGVGGLTPEEYQLGGPRVERFLRGRGLDPARWRAPGADVDGPEAQWGLDPELAEDVERFAAEHGYRVRRLVFERPGDPAPLVADLYRAWLRDRGLHPDRLLVESSVVLEPWWTLRTGAVPFWTHLPVESAFDAVQAYLGEREPFGRIDVMLASPGVEAAGLAPADRWRTLFARAKRGGELIGTDERAFPRDFAVFHRYHDDLVRKIPDRHPLPEPLPFDRVEALLAPGGPVRLAG
jgi:pimeloyl-ACP methyl ester carboxylesterase